MTLPRHEPYIAGRMQPPAGAPTSNCSTLSWAAPGRYMAPFGGYKRSGIGRESGADMIHEYLQTKCVWIDTGNEVPNPFVLR